MIYRCCNENRKSAVLQSPTLNGIDFLEVLDGDAIPLNSPRQRTLLLHCLKPAPAGAGPENVLIEGGESITDVGVDWVSLASAPPAAQTTVQEQSYFTSLADAVNIILVRTSKAGDFSPYTLRLVAKASQAREDSFEITEVLPGFDPQLAEAAFSFKVECGPDFDCTPVPGDCLPASLAPPPINYLAKDYGSFRTVMLDRLNQLLPGWGATSEADFGLVLAELVAYAGDFFSYQQDAVATEAYLGTARKRVSLRRHALLVDYHVHDGCNARAWIQLRVNGNPGDAVFLDRSQARFYTDVPDKPQKLAPGSGNEEAAVESGIQVFEPMYDAFLYPEHNAMQFYTWGDTNCCLPTGATEATLLGAYPNLKPGDILIFEEVKGPQTGEPADADLRHRCAVRVMNVAVLSDPLFEEGTANVVVGAGQAATPVTEIQWSSEDALPFPLCISSTFLDSNSEQQTVSEVSVAGGNVVLADHGVSFKDRDMGEVPPPRMWFPTDPSADRCQQTLPKPVPVRFNPQVPESPLTQAAPIEVISLPGSGNPISTGVVSLGGADSIALKDTNGVSCLTLHATDPAGWPALFGAFAVPNAGNPANFDLMVVYNPPGGAAGIHAQVIVEKLTDLSFNPADPKYAAVQVNDQSAFLLVPSSYAPPAAPPASFPGSATMLSNSNPVALLDSASQPFLTLAAAPALLATFSDTKPSSFGISAAANPVNSLNFDLEVVYNPATALGVAPPVALEKFENLVLANAAAQVNPGSNFIHLDSFAQSALSTVSAYDLMNFDATEAVPVITLRGSLDSLTSTWTARQDLLGSRESDTVFVVEVESDGAATLRFGDDTNGRFPETGVRFTADYRIGNGSAGNVGADSIVLLTAGDARIQACRNPLPASGGMDPESNEQIRRRAPQAFLKQERAVTMADYATWADANPQVNRAVANLRWTGSWYTMFVAVEPRGGGNLSATLAKTLKRSLNRYRLAGQDLELDSPDYVSVELALDVCVDPGYFRSDVQRALLAALGNRVLANGRKGLFYPDNFTFGQTVYLSAVYQTARSIAGVRAVEATVFQPQGVNDPQYLRIGEIPIGPLQVARLENDRSFPGHGRLTINLEGGK